MLCLQMDLLKKRCKPWRTAHRVLLNVSFHWTKTGLVVLTYSKVAKQVYFEDVLRSLGSEIDAGIGNGEEKIGAAT